MTAFRSALKIVVTTGSTAKTAAIRSASAVTLRLLRAVVFITGNDDDSQLFDDSTAPASIRDFALPVPTLPSAVN